MNQLKKFAAPLAAFAVIVAAAAGLTFVHLSQAQGSGFGFLGRGHMGGGISGIVASVSGNTITLTGANNATYTVDASGAQIEKFANNAKTTITVGDIQTGDTLHVRGTVSGTNVTAKNIIDGTLPSPLARPAAAAEGTVASIAGNTITLTGANNTTYTVDAGNAELDIHKPAGTALANSGITNGDNLIVFGTTSGTNVTATRILDGKQLGPRW
ncbi:MAG: hypothetical protein KGJ93_01475 [Patescibacteria group bacterium]|nr:hypothetical protein [Patescibacteria group bacterium]